MGAYMKNTDDQAATATRRYAMDQAIANAKIEGFVPDPEFLAIADQIVNGEVTTEEAIAAFVAQAHAEESSAREAD